jgi:serine/threonine protein kinase
MALEPGIRLGPYEILSPLGAGGMGEVYQARDTRLERTVAVKVLPSQHTSSVAAHERFQREARAVAALQHPNICTIYDVGETDDHQHFIVMELLEGEAIHKRLTRGPFDITQLVDLGIVLADALDAAHGRGLIHRDIKPANIVLTPRGPKLLDFVLVKRVAAAAVASLQPTLSAGPMLTDPGSTVGTVAYMSPEQLRGEELDSRSDLFSLGLVFYEMATGRPAFTGATSAVISAAILDQSPISPRQFRPELPAALEQIIVKMLEKDRDIRCQTASELRADLKRVKRDLDRWDRANRSDRSAVFEPPVVASSMSVSASAPPASDSQVLAALVNRHRVIVALATVVLLVVVAGVIYTTMQGRGAGHRRPRRSKSRGRAVDGERKRRAACDIAGRAIRRIHPARRECRKPVDSANRDGKQRSDRSARGRGRSARRDGHARRQLRGFRSLSAGTVNDFVVAHAIPRRHAKSPDRPCCESPRLVARWPAVGIRKDGRWKWDGLARRDGPRWRWRARTGNPSAPGALLQR